MRILLVAAAAILVGCHHAPPPATPASEPAPTLAALALFAPLPVRVESASNPVTSEKVALGRQLYFDPRFSKNRALSCNSCHDLARYGAGGCPCPRGGRGSCDSCHELVRCGVDGAATTGHRGQEAGRSAPTVYNAALQIAQDWDGRAPDVEAQALGPVTNPMEMAMPDGAAVVKVIRAIPGYVESFAKAFPGEKDPVTLENFGRAIGAFERTLLTPSRWDAYLAGDHAAFTAEERAGLGLFVDTGCASCHRGAGMGGGMYQRAGLLKPWDNQSDSGRYRVTRNEADRMFFKVSSLRNVERLGPYFHDASADTLEEAIATMADRQLGKTLSSREIRLIASFLKALTGNPPAIDPPELPPEGPSPVAADLD